MEESELREALRTVATVDPPPPMSSAAALRTARRARWRHRAMWTGFGSAGSVAAVAVAAVVLSAATGQWVPGHPDSPGPAPGPTDTETAGPWPTGQDGRPQEDRTARTGPHFDKGKQLYEALQAIVPDGYSLDQGSPEQFHRAEFEERVNGVEVWSYQASTSVVKDGRTGRLLAKVQTAGNGLPAEPCEVTKTLWRMGGECRLVQTSVGNVGVVIEPTGDNRLDQWAAYRHPDGLVVYIAQSKTTSQGNDAPLTELPLTVEQLANLVIDQRFRLP
jgi:hypothetical protein